MMYHISIPYLEIPCSAPRTAKPVVYSIMPRTKSFPDLPVNKLKRRRRLCLHLIKNAMGHVSSWQNKHLCPYHRKVKQHSSGHLERHDIETDLFEVRYDNAKEELFKTVYKIDAVKLLTDEGCKISKAARNLEINPSL